MSILANDLGNPLLWTALAIVLVAGLMRGFAGFGSAMMMAPIFAVLIGPARMVVTIVAVELAIGIPLFFQTWRQVDWRIIGPMAFVSCVFMPFGLWLLISLDKQLITIGVSLLVILFVLILMTGWRYRGARPMWMSAGVGAVSGSMMATTSIGGPPVLLYLLASEDGPSRTRANIIAYYFATGIVLIAIVLGAYDEAVPSLIDAATLFPALLAGTLIGARFHGSASDWVYRVIAYVFLLAAGTFGLIG